MPITPRSLSCSILMCQTRVFFSRLSAQQSCRSSFQWRDVALGCHLVEAFNGVFFSPFFIVSWLNGSLLFARIHEDSLTLTVKVPHKCFVGSEAIKGFELELSFHLVTRSCLHMFFFSKCCSRICCGAICTSPPRSPCSFVVYCLKFICPLITSHPFYPFFRLRSLWALCQIWWFFFSGALNESLSLCWLFY